MNNLRSVVIILSNKDYSEMLGGHRIRHHPLITNRKVIHPSPKANHSLSQERIKGNKVRSKTQTDQPILPSYSTPSRRHSLRDAKDNPQKQLFRHVPIKKHAQSKTTVLQRLQVRLPKAQQSKALAVHLQKKVTSKQEDKSPHVLTFQRNILNLAGVCNALLRSTSQVEITAAIRRYILEQDSDLTGMEEKLACSKADMFKQVLFYERVLMIMVIESMLIKRKLCSVIYTQLIKEMVGFYIFIYEEITGSSLQQFLVKRGKGFLSNKMNYDSAVTHGIMVGKRVTSLLKQHPQVQKFVKEQLQTLGTASGSELYYQLLEFYACKLTAGEWLGKGIEFLETCPAPYIRDRSSKKYTILLDLDETLAHYRVTTANKGQFLLRPYIFSFVEKLSQHFEVGIFTCALSDYADIVVDHLKGISFRLYRQHALRINGELVKDLSRVGRDLSKTILIDNLASNFRLQPQNGIHVRSWYGDQGDTVLSEIASELQKITQDQPQDIRQFKHRRSFL